VMWIDRQRECVSTQVREAALQRAVTRVEGVGDWGSGVAKERGSGGNECRVVRRA
jgi:hypothetical protein